MMMMKTLFFFSNTNLLFIVIYLILIVYSMLFPFDLVSVTMLETFNCHWTNTSLLIKYVWHHTTAWGKRKVCIYCKNCKK